MRMSRLLQHHGEETGAEGIWEEEPGNKRSIIACHSHTEMVLEEGRNYLARRSGALEKQDYWYWCNYVYNIIPLTATDIRSRSEVLRIGAWLELARRIKRCIYLGVDTSTQHQRSCLRRHVKHPIQKLILQDLRKHSYRVL